MRDLIVRRYEPEDYEAVHRIYSSPRAMAGTLGVPFSSTQEVREVLARERDGSFPLVACVGRDRRAAHAQRLHEPEDAAFGALRDSGARRLAREGRRHRVDGSLSGPGRQLAGPNEIGSPRLRGQRHGDLALQKVRVRDRRHPQTFRLPQSRVRGRLRHGASTVMVERRIAIPKRGNNPRKGSQGKERNYGPVRSLW